MRRFLVGVALSGALLVATAAQAQAATTIGQSPPTDGTPQSNCQSGGQTADIVQESTASGNSYVVPAGGGVITSWQTTTGIGAASVKLRVFTGAPGSLAPTGESALETVTPASSAFATRVPVSGGEYLGYSLFTGGSSECLWTMTSSASDVASLAISGPLGATEMETPQPNVRANVSAVLEPDADHDGFGDETQDQCPSNAATQGSCILINTSISAHPKAKTTKKQAKFAFKSNRQGATFECSLDGSAFRECLSPRRYNVGVGKHVFMVRSVSAGETDASPASYKWQVKRKSKHKGHGHNR
jgi:spore coat protein U-like protein